MTFYYYSWKNKKIIHRKLKINLCKLGRKYLTLLLEIGMIYLSKIYWNTFVMFSMTLHTVYTCILYLWFSCHSVRKSQRVELQGVVRGRRRSTGRHWLSCVGGERGKGMGIPTNQDRPLTAGLRNIWGGIAFLTL